MNKTTKLKRKIKRFLEKRSAKIRLDFQTTLSIITIISAVIFLLSQLITNAILAPMGKSLASIKKEHHYLEEYTQQMNEDIAISSSLTARKKLSEQKLNLKENASTTIIYINNDTLIASN